MMEVQAAALAVEIKAMVVLPQQAKVMMVEM
jgi:hypothetical protein